MPWPCLKRTLTTRYSWSAQDQLFSVEKGSGGGLQALANYRYNAAGLRAEKLLSDEGLAAASQTSNTASGAASPLAHERIQWDGLLARRSYEVTGAGNSASQTLRTDADAAALTGNTAPWLFNRTSYTAGVGSTTQLHADSNGNLTAAITSEGGAAKADSLLVYSPYVPLDTSYTSGVGSTTQLHADSNGNLTATIASEGGTAKADSLLVYSPYGLIDSDASGNAGTGLKSNGNAFGSYYADPESGLLYARARYFDPASGQFIGRDPQEGEANQRKPNRRCECSTRCCSGPDWYRWIGRNTQRSWLKPDSPEARYWVSLSQTANQRIKGLSVEGCVSSLCRVSSDSIFSSR